MDAKLQSLQQDLTHLNNALTNALATVAELRQLQAPITTTAAPVAATTSDTTPVTPIANNPTAATPAATPMPPAPLAPPVQPAPVAETEPKMTLTVAFDVIQKAAQGDSAKFHVGKGLFKDAVTAVKGPTRQHCGPSWWEANIGTILSHLPDAHFDDNLKTAIAQAYTKRIKVVRRQEAERKKAQQLMLQVAAGVKAEGQ